MSVNFPRLYPDELLYSAVSRYHFRKNNLGFTRTMIDLFDSPKQSISLSLPTKIANNIILKS